ncbi:MAG: hypothetical protein NTY79_07015 [Chloroflexi bacterium]|nr:hypothetical protein [Chloroflexota bacterium]
MQSTWRSTTAGILDIIAGVWALCVVVILFIAGGVSSIIPNTPAWVATLFFGLAIPVCILAVLAVAGGISSIIRKAWGFALAGSIAAFFCSFTFFLWGFVVGIVAIILTAIGRSEFK